MKDYQKTITVNKPADEAYRAVTEHIADWWSNDLSGTSARPQDRFTIRFGNTQKTFEIVVATPPQEIVWACTEAYIASPSLSNKAEWAGTKMYWTLSPSGQGTTIDFRHEGLRPALECYELCEAGWDQFLGSLATYINTGKGMPYKKAD